MDIRVRKAKASDVDALLALKREASTILLTQLGHTLEQIGAWHERFVTREYFLNHVRVPHSLYILEEGEQVKGMAGLTMKNDGDDSFLYFSNLYCLESGNGLGSRLMEHRLGVAENFNVDFIQCHVHSKNDRARRFVEHYGYVEHGTYKETRLGSTQIVYRKYPEA